MQNEQKTVWQYDRANGNQFSDYKTVDADYELQVGETFIEPASDLLDPYFDEQAQQWLGISKEEWDKKYTVKPDEPNKSDQALNTLGLQIAQVQKTQSAQSKEINAQSQALNALGLQIAAAKKNETNTDATK